MIIVNIAVLFLISKESFSVLLLSIIVAVNLFFFFFNHSTCQIKEVPFYFQFSLVLNFIQYFGYSLLRWLYNFTPFVCKCDELH